MGEKIDHEHIVISLTTIKSRISNVSQIIKSILDQDTLPDVINIYYSKENHLFDEGCDDLDINNLKESINNLLGLHKKNVIVKISQTANIGSYRKLIPALRDYPNSIIITIDDDEIFESDLVKILYNCYLEHKCVIASVARIIDLNFWTNMNDTIDYYKIIFSTNKPYMNLLPEGYGSILYKSDMFSEDFINFDYNNLLLDEIVIKNDDIFIRNYLYKKGIKVFVTPLYQSNIYNQEQIKSLFKYNKTLILSKILENVNIIQNNFELNSNLLNEIDLNFDMSELIILHSNQKNDVTKKSVHTGTDVKKLQYKINYNETNEFIDIHNLIRNHFFPISKSNNVHTIMINIEKDVFRYESAVREFKKILIKDFIHLKATYWKEKDTFNNDMNNILRYLQNYNENIVNSNVSLDIFSVFTDPNIMIQDGPLACYCSHVRGMIYGFLNFTDYTLIVEDDFHVNDTELIVKGIKLIPDDWDIICFGAQPINKFYSGTFYKFTDLFHSTQFYIIRNSCMETIFKNIYPIPDQIDILLSKLHSILNIYNIPHSVLQKNFTSNTQNNLYVMYNSPNYQYIRITLDKIKTMLKEIIISKFNTNSFIHYFIKHIDNIVLKMLYDFIFSKIVLADELDDKYFNELVNSNIFEDDDKTNLYQEYFIQNEKNKLYSLIYIIINGCVKGINVDITVRNIISDMFDIINQFVTIRVNQDINMELFPLNYGSTSNVYLGISKDNLLNFDGFKLDKNIVVIKAFSKNLRFKYVNHSNSQDIIQNEITLLKRLQGFGYFPQLIYNSLNEIRLNEIHLTYTGETLFDNFILPSDYKDQVIKIFEILNSNNIYYPEFNLKNITFLDGVIHFIDFGLASEINNIQEINNNTNKQNFIELLDLLNNKYTEIIDIEQQHIYYNNLVVNIKLNSDSKYKNNIF